MTKEIKFKKLFCIAHEGEYYNAVIVYSKRPWVAQTKRGERAKLEEVIVQWRKVLILDLWLVHMRFDWLTPKKVILDL